MNENYIILEILSDYLSENEIFNLKSIIDNEIVDDIKIYFTPRKAKKISDILILNEKIKKIPFATLLYNECVIYYERTPDSSLFLSEDAMKPMSVCQDISDGRLVYESLY